MDLTYVSIVVLASMIFVLSGMVGYLYWQQTRLLQQLQSLAVVVATRITEQQQVAEEARPAEDEEESVTEDDDRVEVVDGPAEEQSPSPVLETDATQSVTLPVVEDDVDDIQNKTVKQLQELLTKKGIPFGKRDAKTVLLQLLRATS